mgnify:CR=1 FL=1
MIIISVTPSATRQERRCKVLVSAKNHNWNAVIAAATPSRCESDRELLPFALLALQNKGLLGDRLFEYPVREMHDLDYQGKDINIGHFFDAVLAESLNLPNEAIHNVFQLNCGRPYGMCFLSLHLLIRNNIEKGNFSMVDKYLRILARSPRFASDARKMLSRLEAPTPAPGAHKNTSGDARLLTKNPIMNIGMLLEDGRVGEGGEDRFLSFCLFPKNVGSLSPDIIRRPSCSEALIPTCSAPTKKSCAHSWI